MLETIRPHGRASHRNLVLWWNLHVRLWTCVDSTACGCWPKLNEHILVKMRRYVLCVTLIFAGIAMPALLSYWVRQEISMDCDHDANTICNRSVAHEFKNYGMPSFVSVIKDRSGADTSVHQENLLIYFVTSISFGFLAGRLWPRDRKRCCQQDAPSNDG